MASETDNRRVAHAGTRAGKIARWTADRAAGLGRRLDWYARLWAMRLRAATGIGGRLPPGPLDAASMRAAATEQFYGDLNREHGPIFKIFWGSGHLNIFLMDFALAKRLFREHSSVLEAVTEKFTALFPNDYLRSMRGDIHRHYRRIFQAAFRPELIDARDAEIRHIMRDELAKLADADLSGEALPKRFGEALDQICLDVLLLCVLGVERDTRQAADLADQYRHLGPSGHVEKVAPPQAAAFEAIRRTVIEIEKSMRSEQSGGHGDSIMRSVFDSASKAALDETVVGNLIYLIERGRHDLRDLMRWVIKHLCDDPGVVDQLRTALAEPAAKPELARACVQETLRLEQAEALLRKVCAPIDFAGHRFPKGSWVTVLLREAHRNADVFSEPASYCPHRFVDRKYTTDQYAPFGIGEHQCVAGAFVIEIVAMLIEELVRGYSWTVVGDGPRIKMPHHWEPAQSFAIELRPVT